MVIVLSHLLHTHLDVDLTVERASHLIITGEGEALPFRLSFHHIYIVTRRISVSTLVRVRTKPNVAKCDVVSRQLTMTIVNFDEAASVGVMPSSYQKMVDSESDRELFGTLR